jgi:hypothetical protein
VREQHGAGQAALDDAVGRRGDGDAVLARADANFGRTSAMTLKWPDTHSSVSLRSSPSLDSPRPQSAQERSSAGASAPASRRSTCGGRGHNYLEQDINTRHLCEEQRQLRGQELLAGAPELLLEPLGLALSA